MKKILIVEDEPMIAQDLNIIVAQAGFTPVGPCDNALRAMELCASSKPDLALLDINIHGSADGIELAESLKDLIPIIFITSYYDETTLKRVEKIKPQAYILKPFREEEVLLNIRLAMAKYAETKPSSEPEKLLIRSGSGSIAICMRDIAVAKGEDNYTRIILCSEEEHIVSQTLKSFQEKLNDQFHRIHKSYIINSAMIEGISSRKVLVKGQEIPLGRSYKSSFLQSMRLG